MNKKLRTLAHASLKTRLPHEEAAFLSELMQMDGSIICYSPSTSAAESLT